MARDDTPGDTSPQTPLDMRRKAFGRNLWNLTLRRGWTQSELARQAGIGRDSISGYMRGKNLPEPTSAMALAKALGVTLEDLYPGASESPAESAIPSFEMRAATGEPGFAWLRINRRVPFSVAAKIAVLLEETKG